jgi:hypothetical protein
VAGRQLLLDACVAINLMATGRLDAIGSAAGVTFLLLRQAAAEAGALRDLAGAELVRTPIDFTPHVRAGTLRVVALVAAELPRYVECARQVDDGEAATIAAAACRGIPLATDDRKARRLCADLGLPAPVRTLALLRQYAEAADLTRTDVRSLLLAVRRRASFAPPRADPDSPWWQGYLDDLT